MYTVQRAMSDEPEMHYSSAALGVECPPQVQLRLIAVPRDGDCASSGTLWTSGTKFSATKFLNIRSGVPRNWELNHRMPRITAS